MQGGENRTSKIAIWLRQPPSKAARERTVDYRVLTIAREFGSGGASVARILAKELGWKLLDRELIEQIAGAAQVDADLVSHHDECTKSMIERMRHRAVRAGAAVSLGVVLKDPFNEKRMTELSRHVVEQAHANCHCVIVGRGAQCILRNQPDVFHVFVYAPLADRLRTLRARLGIDAEAELERRAHSADTERAYYLKRVYGENWRDPLLYNMMVSSHEGDERAARAILCAMTGQ